VRKILKGKCGTSRMTPAQQVAHREQAFPLSPVGALSSRRYGLDFGLEGSGNRRQCDTRLGQKSPVHRSARRLHGIGVRMRYLCSCEAVSHLK
jgi:hypothetical protein